MKNYYQSNKILLANSLTPIAQLLQSRIFLNFANQWFANLNPNLDRQGILTAIGQTVDDRLNHKLHLLVDNNTIVLNQTRLASIVHYLKRNYI